MAYTIMFDDPPETCPTGVADFDTLAELITSPKFAELVAGDEILRRNSTPAQLFNGKQPFDDVTDAFCEYVYAEYYGYPDIFRDMPDDWPELVKDWARACSDYADWGSVCYTPDGDTNRLTPSDIMAVSPECNILINESKEQEVTK